MASNVYDLMGYKVRYETVGYGSRINPSRKFRLTGRKMPSYWEKACYAVFLNGIFTGVLIRCGNKWYLISVNREQTSACMTSGLTRNDAILAFINRYLLADEEK